MELNSTEVNYTIVDSLEEYNHYTRRLPTLYGLLSFLAYQ